MFALTHGANRQSAGAGIVFSAGGTCWRGVTTGCGEGIEAGGDTGGSEVPAHQLRVACEKGKRRRLIKWARVVSVISILMSLLFGAAAMFCGLVGELIISLVAIALETWIDMLSSVAVLWRFQKDDASFIYRSPFTPPTPFGPGGSMPLSKGSGSLPSSVEAPQKRQAFDNHAVDDNSQETCPSSGRSGVQGKLQVPPTPCSEIVPVAKTSAGGDWQAQVACAATRMGEQRPAGAMNKPVPSLPSSLSLSDLPSFLARPVLSEGKQDKSGEASPPPPVERSSGDAFMGRSSRGDSVARPLNHSVSFTAREKYSSVFVGCLFILLAIWVGGQASYALFASTKEDVAALGKRELLARQRSMFRVALYTCLICWPSAVVFGLLAVVKFNLAARLRSEVMGKDATCSAFGVALSLVAGVVGFIALGHVGLEGAFGEGSPDAPASRVNTTVYDASAAMVIGVLMLVEGVRTVHKNSRRRPAHPSQADGGLVVVPGSSAYNHHI